MRALFRHAAACWWLLAAAPGPNAYAKFQWFVGSIIGQLVLFGYTWALIHHMLGGVRHLIWDTGRGFGPQEREWLAAATIVGSLALTFVLCGIRLSRHGGRAMSRRFTMSDIAPKHFRTPLARVRGRGTAKSGTEDFWMQRVTSVAGVPLTIMAIVIVIFLLGRNQAAAAQILGSPLVAIIMLLFIICHGRPHEDRHAGDHRGLCARRNR